MNSMHISENGRDEYDVFGREVVIAQSSVENIYLNDGSYLLMEDPYSGSSN